MIINTHDQLCAAKEAGLPGPYVAIVYHAPMNRGLGAHAVVYSPFFDTGPGGAWYYHGKKGFAGYRDESVPEAITWAKKQYGKVEYVRNRMGDYLPKHIHEAFPLGKKKRLASAGVRR